MKKILLLGKSGQLGWELQRALSPLGEVIALDRHANVPFCGDLTKVSNLVQTVRALAPDVVVNAAGYTAVDKAETETELASLINSQVPGILAREVAALGAWLVYYSTDYVFDGSGCTPWEEGDKPMPLNSYGRSKLAGEQAIQASGCKHLIFRTSWVYGAHGNNFVKTILRLARERETLSVVADQIGAPTGADLLADLTAHALRTAVKNPEVSGLYHMASHGEVSWYDYANLIVNTASALGQQCLVKQIFPIPSSDYITAAKRPLNSRLATTKLIDTFSLQLPHWEYGVVRVIKEILENA